MTVSYKRIKKDFKAIAPKAKVHFADGPDFDAPAEDWVLYTYPKWFREVSFHFGVNNYVPEVSDCDDFASRYRIGMQICRGRMMKGNPIAVCELWYEMRGGQGGHAINGIYVNDPAKLIFIEPQTCEEVDLTKNEMKSIWFVRF